MQIHAPYLLFLGDAEDELAAKTAFGIAHWRPERCAGQLRLAGCGPKLALPELSLDQAARAGVKTLIIGVANRGGVFAESWIPTLRGALERGMDLANGLHIRLTEIPGLADLARAHGCRLVDVRHAEGDFPIATGKRRSGKRLLSVGTDCSVGKMYTALAMEREMRDQGLNADFQATGQTGILIAGAGISVDAVVCDFLAGAVEHLSPANEADHWDVIEGQGSLAHPSYAGVTLGLIHGAQPDALVLCHEPTRSHMRGLPHQPMPELSAAIALNEAAARLTNPAAKCIGLALDTSRLEAAAAFRLVEETEARIGLPCVDPLRHGVGRLIDKLP